MATSPSLFPGGSSSSRPLAGALTALALLALASCKPSPIVPTAVAEETRAELREQSRGESSGPCGGCHLPPGKPGALAVFDLSEPEWAGRMTVEQYRTFLQRLGGDDPRKPSASRRFLEAEAARKQEPTSRPSL